MKTIGEIIYQKRTSRHLSQKKLGEMVGVSGRSIGDWECGKCYPNALVVCDLADLFECTADELLGRKSV